MSDERRFDGGFVVVLFDEPSKRWDLSWDGELHATEFDALKSAVEARDLGYDVRVRPVLADTREGTDNE